MKFCQHYLWFVVWRTNRKRFQWPGDRLAGVLVEVAALKQRAANFPSSSGFKTCSVAGQVGKLFCDRHGDSAAVQALSGRLREHECGIFSSRDMIPPRFNVARKRQLDRVKPQS